MPVPCPGVVSYRNSTSNHNSFGIIILIRRLYLIEILHQTTTESKAFTCTPGLYLIEILHQTTTPLVLLVLALSLYLIEILHQTTTVSPALTKRIWLYLIEILHQTTTFSKLRPFSDSCILSKFYIKPQRRKRYADIRTCCILSKFYIKPQPMDDKECLRNVVSYRNSTSNHNFSARYALFVGLYLIEILHQTTTFCTFFIMRKWLYLIEILHQTTTLPEL